MVLAFVPVYLDPSAYALAAAYVDTDGITWEEKVLRFSDGSYIEGGVFHDPSGERARIQEAAPGVHALVRFRVDVSGDGDLG